jgi:glutathione S-transferase
MSYEAVSDLEVMMLKLYQHPLSTFARRVAIALLEKNLEVEWVEVDMAHGAHRQEPYLSLNPYGRVPTLVDDGFVLFESTAILEYVEAKYPDPSLVPADIKDRARVSMHMKLCDLQMTRPAGTIVFPKRFIPKERWRTDEMAKAKQEIEKHLGILDRQLEDRTYLVAERYTLADLCYVPFVDLLSLMEIAPPARVASWVERILSRTSSVATKPPH